MPDLQWTHPWVLLALLLVPWLPHWLGGFAAPGKLAGVIHPGLLRHLLIPAHRTSRGRPAAKHLLRLFAILSILTLAGPTLPRQVPEGFIQSRPLVLALDLSLSMFAQDLPPSRLERARQEIQDVLRRAPDRDIALMAWAGDAFRVVPFTRDHDTLRLMLPDLSPAIMPAPGSRPDRLMMRAREMLKPGQDADMLILGDGLNPDHLDDFRAGLKDWPGRVSWLLTATPEGAPIPIPGQGFLEENGQLIMARAEVSALDQLARENLLQWAFSRPDDLDLNTLLSAEGQLQKSDALRTRLSRQDVGHWLLIPLLVLWLMLMPRLVLPACIVLVLGTAPSPARALEWQDLWLNPDQRAWQALQEGDADTAARLARDPALKGAALYRAGKYREAARAFGKDQTATGHYNRGNALAQSGDLEGAKEAWLRALALNPDLEQARRNLELLDRLKRESGSGGQQGQDNRQNQEGQRNPGHQNDQTGPGNASDRSGQSGTRDQQGRQSGSGDQTSRTQTSGQHNEEKASGPSPEPRTRGNPADAGPDERQPGAPENRKSGQSHDQLAAGETSGQPKPGIPETDAAADGTTTAGQSGLSDDELRRWLRRIPDTPGQLLQRKFMQQYRERDERPDKGEPIW